MDRWKVKGLDMQILVTNDDGIHAPGLSALANALRSLGDVQVVAPASEQSGVGMKITYLHPLLVHEEKIDGEHYGWAVAGTPADCVKLGMLEFCRERPTLVVSGINPGPNVGINVLYSGTVAAAIEGAFFGVTSIAVSRSDEPSADYTQTAMRAVRLIEQILATNPQAGSLWNINFPET
ncbi:MAG: 5'/3'-nucleotidase SurE, partial [Planctomycetaceae bacterium]